MAAASLFLGIDIGTGGSKALLIDAQGRVAAKALTEYPLSSPRPLWSEQSPEQWWEATIVSIRAVIAQADIEPRAIAGVGLTGQMHGLVLLDGRGGVLRPAILWNDQRTQAQCEAIHQRIGRERIMAITGKPMLTGFTAPKLLWVKDHEPEVYARIAHILLPKDYVRYRLTGEFFSDVADASGTSWFDCRRRAWSEELIEALEIPRDWLPQVTESPVASAKVSVAGASATGLLEGTPVIAGAGDQAAEAVGSGIIAPALGIVSVTVGTSGVVFAAMGDYRIDPTGGMHAFCHALPGMWHVMGVMLSAGGSLRWFRDVLGGGATYEQIIDSARTVPAGCEGLVFLPYLSGERTPHADPNARGAFVGLTLRHTKAHLARAVLEGVTFGLRNALDLARHMGVGIERIRVSGGGARSAFWKQMMADVFAVPVASPQVVEGAAYGAAILAAVGAWGYPGVREAVAAMVNEGDEVRPGSRTGAYEEVYGLYNGLYPALKPHFEAVATEAGAMS